MPLNGAEKKLAVFDNYNDSDVTKTTTTTTTV